jgi:peptidylprolyl isomerase domain and WD repeat-containing protein 1
MFDFVKSIVLTDPDMINIIKLDYEPSCICWTYRKGDAQTTLCVADRSCPTLYLYDGKSGESQPLHTISGLHHSPVEILKFNSSFNAMVSVDAKGFVEYWQPDGNLEIPPTVGWEFKSDTDLFEFVKDGALPTSLNFSLDGSKFVAFGSADGQVRVFRFADAKMIRKYDESMETVAEMQQAGTLPHKMDDMEFGRRMAFEKEMGKSPQRSTLNAIFDESGNFILYPSLIGIKIVNIVTNKVSRVVGNGETLRFMNIALYQGMPKKKSVVTLVSSFVKAFLRIYFCHNLPLSLLCHQFNC